MQVLMQERELFLFPLVSQPNHSHKAAFLLPLSFLTLFLLLLIHFCSTTSRPSLTRDALLLTWEALDLNALLLHFLPRPFNSPFPPPRSFSLQTHTSLYNTPLGVVKGSRSASFGHARNLRAVDFFEPRFRRLSSLFLMSSFLAEQRFDEREQVRTSLEP